MVSCHKIRDQLPRAQTWRQISNFVTKTRHFSSHCTVRTSCTKPFFHCVFYIYHYTLLTEHEQQTEKRLLTVFEISAPHSMFKLVLKLSFSLQLLGTLILLFWAVSLLVFVLWLNALDSFAASVQTTHLGHEGTKDSDYKRRCWISYKHCKRDISFLPSTNDKIFVGTRYIL